MQRKESEAEHKADEKETFPAETVDALIAGDNPIKVYRKFRDMPQDDLAHAIKKSKADFAKLESGE
jgi:ribosome-binding protein aMBF1 (putative translation factor)